MGFVDLHCHILPGIDDGAKSLEQSLEMLRLAAEHGTQVMVATPHMMPGTFDNTQGRIQRAFEQYRVEVAKSGLGVQVNMAAEVHLCAEIMLWQQQGQLPTLGCVAGKQVLLLELPHSRVPQGVTKLIKWLMAKNILPMIAHPERNRGVWQEPYYLQQWRRMGCLFQVTAGALLGEFREQAQAVAEQMLANDMVDVVASDCHGPDKRTPVLSLAYERVSELHNEALAKRLFIVTPGSIIDGRASHPNVAHQNLSHKKLSHRSCADKPPIQLNSL